MATHDHAIVDAMQRRVVAVENGAVVRDDATGRYETTMQHVIDAGSTTVPGDQPTGAPPEPSPQAAEAAEEAIGSESPDLEADGEQE